MSKIFLHLQEVHDLVHELQIKHLSNLATQKKFSTPKIFTGGVNVKHWNKLKESEKKIALSKKWYVYYSFRNSETGKLVRMPNIKGDTNSLKTMSERVDYLNTIRSTLEFLLEKGFNPYELNDVEALLGDTKNYETKHKNKIHTIEKEVTESDNCMSIKDAFDYALKNKKNSISDTSYKNFELRIRKFKKSLDEKKPITTITKKVVNEYLNKVLDTSSARNRNNTRTDLSSLFQVLEDNEIIVENIIKKISVLKSNPERNKTFTPELQKNIYEFLEKNDPILLLFIKFVSYNFLRPVEVCRLKIKDLDVIDKKLYVKAKNKLVKIKIIPQILINDLPDLSGLNPDNYLFTPSGLGQEWIATENNRRDNFTKRFKEVVKGHFNLNQDYGMYSFRHTFITKLYRELRKNYSQFETKSKLMLITGHSSMTALEKYLRDIDAELPDDYSHLIK